MKIHGSCTCGFITFEAEADPEKVAICHCTDCQSSPERHFGRTSRCRATRSGCSPARRRSLSRQPPRAAIRGRRRSVPNAARRCTRRHRATGRSLHTWSGSACCASATNSFRRCRTGRVRRGRGSLKSAHCGETKRPDLNDAARALRATAVPSRRVDRRIRAAPRSSAGSPRATPRSA